MSLHRNRTRKSHSFRIILVLVLLSLTACSSSENTSPSATPTPVTLETSFPAVTPTLRPTSTPTLPPLGAEGNPLIIGYTLAPEQSEAMEAAEDIAFMIENETGYAIESRIYPDFQNLSKAVLDGEVDLFWLEPLEYIYLHSQDASQAILMTNHLGVYTYGVQFLANEASGFNVYYDSETSQSTTNSSTVLQQFAGTRPCFIHPDSIPGYFLPLGLLAEASTPTLDPVFTYDYSAAIRALYIQGICDFGVSYAMIGDPFTASEIIEDLPDVQERVIVIWQSDGVIPNLNLSASPELPLNIRYIMEEALLDLSKTPDGLTLLSTALNYDIGAIKSITDRFYDPLRNLLYLLELDLEVITGAGR
jgi:phosphonate transport system substrate-binding protein